MAIYLKVIGKSLKDKLQTVQFVFTECTSTGGCICTLMYVGGFILVSRNHEYIA